METVLDRYIAELSEDVKVDAFNIKDVQMKLPAIKHKWAGRYIRCKQDLFKLRKEREEHKKSLVDRLQKEAAVKINEYNAAKTIENNNLLRDYDAKIEECNFIIEILEETKKTLSSMTYDIKNIIEIIKLETT